MRRATAWRRGAPLLLLLRHHPLSAVSNALLLLPSDCCAAHREPHLVGRAAAATGAGTAYCLPVCAVPLLLLCPPCSPAWERAAVAQVPPPPPSGIFEDSPMSMGKQGHAVMILIEQTTIIDQDAFQLQNGNWGKCRQ